MSIKSQALRDSAGHWDAKCELQIAGVCKWPEAGNMLCHIRVAGEVGGGQKPDDTMASFGCLACHNVFDGNGTKGLSEADWNFYALRGMARTLRWWYAHDYLSIKGAK